MCEENPDNKQDEADEDDSNESNKDPATSVAVDGYRCLGCGESFGTERGVRVHQGRSRDCTGADIEPVEQTDTSERAGSAADSTGDDGETPDDTDDEDDPELDPAVGAVPIDPDTVDEAVIEDDEAEETEDKHRVRREPSTVREVLDAAVSGRYLCMDCGFSAAQGKTASRMKAPEFRSHGPYTDEGGTDYRQLADVPEDVLAERWLVIYKNVGSRWTHPKVHEARKNGIVTVLEEADEFLSIAELRERINQQWGTNYNGEEPMTRKMLTDDPGYLDELVEEGRIERDGKRYAVVTLQDLIDYLRSGAEAESSAEPVEATG